MSWRAAAAPDSICRIEAAPGWSTGESVAPRSGPYPERGRGRNQTKVRRLQTGTASRASVGLVALSIINGILLADLPAAPATLCRDLDRPLVTDLELRQAPPAKQPAAGTPFRDPVFHTCQVRLTDRAADIAADDRSGGLKNEYSRVQAFNADESALLIRGTAATWYLYDAASLRRVRKLCLRWPGRAALGRHRSRPDLFHRRHAAVRLRHSE